MTPRDPRVLVATVLLLVGCTASGCSRRMPPTDDPVPPQPPAPPSAAPPSAAPARQASKPPAEPPPSPQIVLDDAANAVGEVEQQLRKCEALGGELAGRDLAADQRTQLDSARRFLTEARQALAADEVSRAEVLAGKGCQLLDAIRGGSPGN